MIVSIAPITFPLWETFVTIFFLGFSVDFQNVSLAYTFIETGQSNIHPHNSLDFEYWFYESFIINRTKCCTHMCGRCNIHTAVNMM